MRPSNGKALIKADNELQFQQFLKQAGTDTLTLPVASYAPGRALSKRQTVYSKEDVSPNQEKKLFCIKQDGKTHSFIWHTDGKTLRQGIRWGIIKPESLSAKVIASLGHYRITVHERILKGMATATQAYKLELLDFAQDRLEKLAALESLVNKPNTVEDFEKAIQQYTESLQAIRTVENLNHFIPNGAAQSADDIQQAIQRAKAYLQSLRGLKLIHPANRARGQHSILEFVKRESLQTLYELQAYNQAITYSNKRSFALTRGDLNDDIEDARKIIDDHRGDPRNIITDEHHCHYANEAKLSYHFDPKGFSPNQERQSLLALSFIEGWDSVQYPKATQFEAKPEIKVLNPKQEQEYLTIIRASKWVLHRGWTALFKSLGYFFLNALKNCFVSILPWRGEAWKNKNFHLHASVLQQHSRPTKPVWLKLFLFMKKIYHALADLFFGIRDVASSLVIGLPKILVNDWLSTSYNSKSHYMKELYEAANAEVASISKTEKERLDELLSQWKVPSGITKTTTLELQPVSETRQSVDVPYPLTAGEQNDILSSIVRGLNSFLSVFTHNIYSKDPAGGVLFTLAYLSGGAALLLPSLAKTVFGEAYVAAFAKIARAMAATPIAGTIAAGSSQAQLSAWAWDVLMHGPKSGPVEVGKSLIQDPLTISLCFCIAYGVGYALVNGIDGKEIPGLSEKLREELGTFPQSSYPITGAKILVTLYEILHNEQHPLGAKLHSWFKEQIQSKDPNVEAELTKIQFATWLQDHAAELPKLSAKTAFLIEQKIEQLFNQEEAKSLKLYLSPPKSRSIAYQLISIPLSYIQSILRLVVCTAMSLLALVLRKQHPWQPMKRAATALFSQISYDLTRLLIFGSEFIRMIGKGIGCVLKAFAFCLNLIVGRIAGLLGLSADHAIHRGFAAIHRGIAYVREWLYPSAITRAVITSNPNSTLLNYHSSYEALMRKMLAATTGEQGNQPQPLPKVDGLATQTKIRRSKSLTDIYDQVTHRSLNSSMRLSCGGD